MIRLGDAAGASGFSLVSLESVDSTNRLALDLAEQAGANRTWVISEVQRAGRGRHGREWVSPAGNLYASLLLVAPCPTEDSPKLGFVAGVALAEVVRKLAPAVETHLKWPNDVLVGNAKLAGILLEGRMLAGGRQAVAIGMGVNIASAPDLQDRAAASFSSLGIATDRRDVFRILSDRMADQLAAFAQGQGFFKIRDAWSRLSLPPGTPLTVRLPKENLSGRFAGIDERGRLMLDQNGTLTHVEAGDVFLDGSRTGAGV